MVRSKGFEPLTAGTANRCSIQLSYERIFYVGRNYTIYNLAHVERGRLLLHFRYFKRKFYFTL